MWPDGFPTGDYVRQARRRLELSQRDLAKVVRVSRSTLARLEAGGAGACIETLERVLDAAGMELVVVEISAGSVEPDRLVFVPPLREWSGPCRDGGGRRYPAHLPVVLAPEKGEWWGDWFGLVRPPETFYRSRVLRDVRRSESRWSVRH